MWPRARRSTVPRPEEPGWIGRCPRWSTGWSRPGSGGGRAHARRLHPSQRAPAGAEAALVNRITEILRHEGFDPANAVTRSVSWVFVHRAAVVYVGGTPADVPRYKVIPSVSE